MENYSEFDSVIKPTGEYLKIDKLPNRIPVYDPITQEHSWITQLTYRVNPERLMQGESALFDSETMLAVNGPLCYHCELPLSRLLLTRRCKGNP